MNEAKHTPGPWEWRDVAGAGLSIYGDVSATMGKDFAHVVEIFGLGACGAPRFQISYERWVQFPKRDWDEMQQANARLIAAAPDLLDALRTVVAADLEPTSYEQLLKRVRTALAKATGGEA